MTVRLLGLLLVGLALAIFRRPRSFAGWTARVNEQLFERETTNGERRATELLTIAFGAVLMMIGAYYVALGSSALPGD